MTKKQSISISLGLPIFSLLWFAWNAWMPPIWHLQFGQYLLVGLVIYVVITYALIANRWRE